jgi:uncharacterized alpha-E superfamily protein
LHNLLARFAANAFWTGRYMERAENLARILDVNETFSRGSTEEESWLPIVRLHADEGPFFERHGRATAQAVVHYYTLDKESPNAIIASIAYARENARTMRHLISTEMWSQLNVFNGWMNGLTMRDIRLTNLSRLCAQIKEGCQTHAGVLEGTLFRDQVWSFYMLGKQVERAGQISRLVDVKSHLLDRRKNGAKTAIAISQWNALLRSAAGYHAYRRIYPRGMDPDRVLEFFFFNTGFPRSVAHCLSEIDVLLAGLARGGLDSARHLRADLSPLDDLMHAGDVRLVRQRGLTAFIDDLQRELDRFSDELGARFFDWPGEEPADQHLANVGEAS